MELSIVLTSVIPSLVLTINSLGNFIYSKSWILKCGYASIGKRPITKHQESKAGLEHYSPKSALPSFFSSYPIIADSNTSRTKIHKMSLGISANRIKNVLGIGKIEDRLRDLYRKVHNGKLNDNAQFAFIIILCSITIIYSLIHGLGVFN